LEVSEVGLNDNNWSANISKSLQAPFKPFAALSNAAPSILFRLSLNGDAALVAFETIVPSVKFGPHSRQRPEVPWKLFPGVNRNGW
jgi:hypothetical protein